MTIEDEGPRKTHEDHNIQEKSKQSASKAFLNDEELGVLDFINRELADL